MSPGGTPTVVNAMSWIGVVAYVDFVAGSPAREGVLRETPAARA